MTGISYRVDAGFLQGKWKKSAINLLNYQIMTEIHYKALYIDRSKPADNKVFFRTDNMN